MEATQETTEKEVTNVVSIPDKEPDQDEKVDVAPEKHIPKELSAEELEKHPELKQLAGMGIGMAQAAMAQAQAAMEMSAPDLKKPVMAGEAQSVGPQGPVGPKRLRKVEDNSPAAVMPLEKPAEEPKNSPEYITLSRERILEVELIGTKKQLADSDEKLIMASLAQIRQRTKDLNAQEAQLLHQIREEHGIGVGKSIRLVDKETGRCKVE